MRRRCMPARMHNLDEIAGRVVRREDGREPALNPPCDQSALPEVLAAIKAQIRSTRERVCSSEKARSIAPRADSCCGCANDSLLADRANSGRRSSDRGPSLLRDFELDWSPCLFLNHGATFSHPAAGAYVIDLQADEIATSELLSIARLNKASSRFRLQLKPNANGPDIFRLKRALFARSSGPCSRDPACRKREVGSRYAWLPPRSQPYRS